MDELAKIAWMVYAPSRETLRLPSERNRLFHPEDIFYTENQPIEPLTVLVVRLLARTFNGGPLDERVQLDDKHLFGRLLDIEKPIEKLCQIDIDVFWKRVISVKQYHALEYVKACKDPQYKWKIRGIEHKVVELLETTPPDEWHLEYLVPIMQTVSPYVTELEIQQLLPTKLVYLEPYLTEQDIFDMDETKCSHGTLEILGHLKNLKVLKLRFGVKQLGREFQRRYFKMSLDDALGLATGLHCLDKLEVFCLNRSDVNAEKLEPIAKSMLVTPLVEIDLSFCNLQKGCGKWIGIMFEKNETLKRLELRGNFLDADEMIEVENALFKFKGTLEYFGLSMNPLKFQGIHQLGRGFFGTRHVKELNLAGCQNSADGVWRVLQIIDAHAPLTHLDMCGMDLTSPEAAAKLMTLMESNYNLEVLECRECGLTPEDESKIKQILIRNCSQKYPPEPPFKLKPKKYDHRRRPIPFDTIPSFIPEEQRVMPSNTETLKAHYHSCFGSDSDMQLFKKGTVSDRYLVSYRHDMEYYAKLDRKQFLERAQK